MTTVEELLSEVADAPPCGPDLSSDLAFVQLDQLAQGKPERSSGDSVIAAEPPPWPEVYEQARVLLSRSKDLRLAVLFLRAGVALEELRGLVDGLQLVHGLLERYWDNLHPSLDPVEGDAVERMNALADFADRHTGGIPIIPIGVQEVRGSTIFRSRGVGQATLRDIEIGLGVLKGAKSGGVSQQQLTQWAGDAATKDPASYAAAAKALQAARQARKLSSDIEQLLAERVKGGAPPTFRTLRQTLDAALTFETAFGTESPAKGGTGGPVQGADSLVGQDQPVGQIGPSTVVRSREEAVKLLDVVCEFLERTEPANPAPLLIQRGKRLMTMRFVDIVKELAPDSLAQIEKVAGQKLTQ
jgi:type VI secretion system protein ImpA